MTNGSRRYLHRPLDLHLISDYIDEKQIESVSLLSAGSSNSNYKLAATSGDHFVLRLYSRSSAEREKHILEHARQVVPVPRMLACGDDWALFNFVEGRMLGESNDDFGAAAEMLAELSRLTFDQPGLFNDSGSVQPFPFGTVSGYYSMMLADPNVQQWLGAERLVQLTNLLQTQHSRLTRLDSGRNLVHGDYNPTNILVDRGKVVAILDWEHAHVGTGFMDIGNLLRHADSGQAAEIEYGLLRGGLALPPDWQQMARLIDITSQLEFLTSTWNDLFKKQAVRAIDRFLQEALDWQR